MSLHCQARLEPCIWCEADGHATCEGYVWTGVKGNNAAWLPLRLSRGGIHIPGKGGVTYQAVPAPHALRQDSHLLHSQRCNSECGGGAATWQQRHEYHQFLLEGRACVSCFRHCMHWHAVKLQRHTSGAAKAPSRPVIPLSNAYAEERRLSGMTCSGAVHLIFHATY